MRQKLYSRSTNHNQSHCDDIFILNRRSQDHDQAVTCPCFYESTPFFFLRVEFGVSRRFCGLRVLNRDLAPQSNSKASDTTTPKKLVRPTLKKRLRLAYVGLLDRGVLWTWRYYYRYRRFGRTHCIRPSGLRREMSCIV